jgi:hypothetical protein
MPLPDAELPLEAPMTSPRSLLTLALAAAPLLLAPVSSAAAPPTADAVLDRLLAAAGGQKALGAVGMVELRFADEETKADGTTTATSDRAVVSGGRVEHARYEMSSDVVLARNPDVSWATIGGELDSRPQTPMMASGSINRRLFSALLPFSLGQAGVTLGAPRETRFEGAAAWVLDVTLPRSFFANPIMDTTWQLFVAQGDLSFLCLELRPPMEYVNAGAQGVRYRVLKTQRVGGARIPAEILTEAIDVEGAPTGNHRVTRIAATAHERWDPALFIDPQRLALIEGEE